MIKKNALFLILLIAKFSFGQTPNGASLVTVHSINNLSDTASIINPETGSLIYVVNDETSYQYNGVRWSVWYKMNVTNISQLVTLVNNFTIDVCCNLPIEPVDCGSATTCIGDILNCGVVVKVNSNNAWVVAPDDFNGVQWNGEICGNSTYLGGAGISTNQIVNACPNDVNAARLALEYKPDGCPTQQWILPNSTMLSNLVSNLSTVNPILEFLGGKRVFVGDQYWTTEEQGTNNANQYIIGSGSSSITKTLERKVRPFAVVPI